VLSLLGACSTIEQQASDPDGGIQESVASTSDPLSVPGMEKIVPLRIVHLLSCNPSLSSCAAWKGRYDKVLRSVEAANGVYREAGIQFYVASYEAHETPALADLTKSFPHTNPVNPSGPLLEPETVMYSSVRTQLQKLFPTLSNSEWDSDTKKTPDFWLLSAATVVGVRDNPEQYVLWIPEYSMESGASYSAFPNLGRNVVLTTWGFDDSLLLAHELGHAFGLVHSWYIDNDTDPVTGLARTPHDSWDLVYKPGDNAQLKPHVFFSTRAEAAAYPASDLRPINTRDSQDNCFSDPDAGAALTCTIQPCAPGGSCRSETHSTGSPALKALSFTYAPSGSAYGTNLMGYYGLNNYPRSLSDSQIDRVRKHLRWSVPINVEFTTNINKGRNNPTKLSTHLPLLGNAKIRQVADELDVDCDGKRDLAVWEPPPAGQTDWVFRVLLSSKNYSTAAGNYMQVSLGRPGDQPFVAEMSGDCRADVGVFQPGGGVNRNDPTDTSGVWRWCPTATNPTQTNCSNMQVRFFGDRGDVPLPGLKFGTNNAVRYLATFTPSNGAWMWRNASGTLPNLPLRVVFLGDHESVLLPGKYDADSLTDLAVYQPSTGYFRILRSELNYTSVISRSFGTTYVPQVTGNDPWNSAAQRSGAIPLSGMTAPMYLCEPVTNVFCQVGYYPRRVFSLYYPNAGTWSTMWNLFNSTGIDTCAFGDGQKDIPIPGVRVDGTLYTGMAYLRGNSGANAVVSYKAPTPTVLNSCSGSTSTVTLSYSNAPKGPRVQAFAVSDMTGDGKPDVLIVDPDKTSVHLCSSGQNFTCTLIANFNNRWAQLL